MSIMKKNIPLLILFLSTSIANAQNTNCSPTFNEIFDFEVGDVFHYSNVTRQDDHDGSTIYAKSERIEILDKIVTGDTTKYYREIEKENTYRDTLIIVDDGKHTLHACDSTLVQINQYLHPYFTSQGIDTTDLYAFVRVYKNDTVRYLENDIPQVVKAINVTEPSDGFFTKPDSNSYTPFTHICENLIMEYVAGAGLLYE